MSVLDWFRGSSEPNERAATNPIEFNPPTFSMYGRGMGTQPDKKDLLRESRGIADMATRAIANRVGTLNPNVVTKRSGPRGTHVEEILDDHILKQRLDRPHPNLSRFQILRLTAQHIVTVGEAFWLKVGDGLGLPAEFHPIPPAQVVPIIRDNVVAGYGVQSGDGQWRELPSDVIIRFFFPDPESPWESEGYLGPQAITADSAKFAGQHLRGHYQHDAAPRVMFELDKDAPAPEPDAWERFKNAWRQSYHQRYGEDQGIPGRLPPGWTAKELQQQTGSEMVPLMDYWLREHLMSFGVPRSVLGEVTSGDRSSAETNQYVFDLHTVTPIAKLIEDTLTAQLAYEFDPSLCIEFAPFVSRDKKWELERELQDLEHAVRTVNQVRSDRMEDPVEWGDEPTISTKIVTYDPDAEPVAVDAQPAVDTETDDDEDERLAVRRKRGKRSRRSRSSA